MTETLDETLKRLAAKGITPEELLSARQTFEHVHAEEKFRIEHPEEWAAQVKKNTEEFRKRKT